MLRSMNTAPHHIAIVTGASRGLGQAIAEQLLAATGTRLLTISRQPKQPSAAGSSTHEAWSADLADPVPLAGRLETWLREAVAAAPQAAVSMIHNAALLSPPGWLAASDASDLSASMRVNLEAPLVLSAAFARGSGKAGGARKLLLISSGLGRRAMAGAVAYCAAKAGMDHLARALALEEAQAPNGIRVVSLAPGVIATDMQVQLRSADPTLFPEKHRFAGLHASGALDTPDTAAAKVLRVLMREDFGSNTVTDVRDA
jgi:NAD(P)-dependent dehydrogenase (short-subunit alcohol dehydrogenase family)